MQSKLVLSTKLSAGKTQIDRYFVSSPFKVLPVPDYEGKWRHGLRAVQMSSSPGLLSGDELHIDISVAKDTALSLVTQAFTRVQSMNAGDEAVQFTRIRLAENSRLFYLPHPLVLHKDSGFRQKIQIELADNSTLIYGEITAVGRVLNGERFAFHHFSSQLEISYADRLLLRDKIQWHPYKMSLTALSQMEDFSHQGALIFMHTAKSAVEFKQILTNLQERLLDRLNTPDGLICVSQPAECGLIVRALGYKAEFIQNLFEELGRLLKDER